VLVLLFGNDVFPLFLKIAKLISVIQKAGEKEFFFQRQIMTEKFKCAMGSLFIDFPEFKFVNQSTTFCENSPVCAQPPHQL